MLVLFMIKLIYSLIHNAVLFHFNMLTYTAKSAEYGKSAKSVHTNQA